MKTDHTSRMRAFLIVLAVGVAVAAAAPGVASATWYYVEIQGAGRVVDHLPAEGAAAMIDLTSPTPIADTSIGASQWADLPGSWGFRLTATAPDGWAVVGYQGIRFWGDPPGTSGAGWVDYLHCDGANTDHFKAGSTCSFTADLFGRYWGVRVIFDDVRAPSVTSLSGTSGRHGGNEAGTWTFSKDEDGGRFQCNFDGGAWFTCTSGASYGFDSWSLAHGEHTFNVRAEDASLQIGPTASQSFFVDRAGPTTTISSGPPSPTASTSATFAFFASNESGDLTAPSFSCSIDGGAFNPCASGQSYGGLLDGTHTFAVAARDGYGNSGTTARWSWRIDTTGPRAVAPAQQLVQNLTLGTTVPVYLSWGATDPSGIASYDLKQVTTVNGVPNTTIMTVTSKSAFRQLTPAAGTTYQFAVRARDSLGNVGAWANGPMFRANVVQETPRTIAPTLTYSGTWRSLLDTTASGGAVRTSSTPGSKATFTFTGRNVGAVMPTRADLGTVKVCIDGTVNCSTIDLSPATGLGARKLVFVRNRLTTTVNHVVTVEVVSGRVDLDAFVRLV